MSTQAPPPLSAAELLELADLNLAESFREHARWSAAGAVDERDDTLRALSATRFAAGLFNGVLCTGRCPDDPAAWLAAQRTFYANHQRGFSIYLRGERDAAIGQACIAAGLTLTDSAPGMACDAPVAVAPLAEGVTVEQVNSVEVMRELVPVLAGAYALLGLPESVTHKVLGEAERLFRPHLLWLLARHKGVPAAAAMVLFSHSIAGLYWVGTRPELRGHALGEACTRVATNLAFAYGARAVVLQASALGRPVYLRIGFREITSYPWFLSPRS
jgi:ribosomal protein S18 acetylase RimI-like enzyme